MIEEVGEEILVYDLRNDRAHCLNPTAARVWKYADGRTSNEAILGRLKRESDPGANLEVIVYALDRLERSGLLDSPKAASARRITRRELAKSLGRAAVGSIPLVTSVLAPTAAHAQSRISVNQCVTMHLQGACCNNNKQCVPGSKAGTYRCAGPSC